MKAGPPTFPGGVDRRIKELIEAYRRAGERIDKELQKAALTSFRRFNLGAHKQQIATYIRALDALAADTAKVIAPKCYEVGADLATDALREQGVKVSSSMGSRINTAGVQAVTDQMALDFLSSNRAMEQSAMRLLRRTQQMHLDERQINDIIADGLVQGETRRAASSRLRDALVKELGDGVRVQAGSRSFKPDYYAEMVTRTRTREAVTEGAIRTGQANGVCLFRVSVHQNPCEEVCQALQGKIFATVEGTGFPMMTKRPPYHPSCKHVAVPYVPKDDEEEERLREFSNNKETVGNLEDYQGVVKGRAAKTRHLPEANRSKS